MSAATIAVPIAGLALGCALIALAWLHQLQQTVHAKPRPFWMGEWPPARGAILDGAYRYDHLPLDGLDDDIVHAVLLAGLRPGETLTRLAKGSRPAAKAPEQAGRGEDIHATCRIDVDAPCIVDARIQLVATVAAPDRDAVSRGQAVGQLHPIVRITHYDPANQLRLAEVAIYEAVRREAQPLDRDVHETPVDDANTEAAGGVRIEDARVGARELEHLPTLQPAVLGVPERHDAQPDAVATQRPPGVDDTKHGTKCGTRDRQRAGPIDAAQPSGQGHAAVSPVDAGGSIAQGGAA